MLALVQRVSEASVTVAGETTGRIGTGLLVFVCAQPDDDDEAPARLLRRLLALRCFADERGRMNLNLATVGGALLLVPQFTLAADTASGNRPGLSGAAPPARGRELFERMVELARASVPWTPESGAGVFGADMQVALVNDGPVTLWLRERGTSETV